MNAPASLLLPLGLIVALIVTAMVHPAPTSPGMGEVTVISATASVTAPARLATSETPSTATPTRPPKQAFLANTPITLVTATPVPASLPTRTPDTPTPATPPQPTATPIPAVRAGCDPAYPDESTCIPPGPPFDQGCAITMERNFTVLPPDPQRLDKDKDGIGCEPY
ncbi:MAG: hypothetical protein U0031_14020 [Thermomicrobiales bacterium]